MEKQSDPTFLTTEMMEQMLDEIAVYSIDIEEDPTQIHLGIPYLQRVLAKCRSYTNRVTFYMQKVKRYETRLRSEQKILQLDLEFKMNEKLADDALVRKQSSIDDRKALAATMLSIEHQQLAELTVKIQDVEENYKIIKAKHTELQRTSNDIKTQRNLVKDDMLARLGGGEGYLKPQVGQDKSIPNGLPPPVSSRVNPIDILVGVNKPAEPMPYGEDDEDQATRIMRFLNTPGKISPTGDFIPDSLRTGDIFPDSLRTISISSTEVNPENSKTNLTGLNPTGTICSACKEPQMNSPGGVTCRNGHGGAEAFIHPDYEDILGGI